MKKFLLFPIWLLWPALALAELSSAGAAEVQKALLSGVPTVLDLGARTCIPCKKMAPILEKLAGDYQGRAHILFIDVRADQAAAKRFRIQMIPTQIFFDKNGKEVKRHIGEMDRAAILQELQALGLK